MSKRPLHDLPECPLCKLPRTINRMVNFTYTIVEGPVYGRYSEQLKMQWRPEIHSLLCLKKGSPHLAKLKSSVYA